MHLTPYPHNANRISMKCTCPPEHPIITSCGHIFCLECIVAVIGIADPDAVGGKCPECQIKFDGYEAMTDEEQRLHRLSMTPGPQNKTAATRIGLKSVWKQSGGKLLQSKKTDAVMKQLRQWKEETPEEKVIVFTSWIDMYTTLFAILLSSS